MSVVRMKGKNVEEAIKGALEVLNVPRESAKIRVISEGEQGILGVFGGKDAEVEVKIKIGTAEAARRALQEILDLMGFVTTITIHQDTEDGISLEIKGDDISRIIGREGQTIDAIQYLVSIIANKDEEQKRRVYVDADGYRKKQEKRVERIAKETAEEVNISGKEIELPPMTARERRIVHITIKGMDNLTSHSIGDRNDRRVVVSPKSTDVPK